MATPDISYIPFEFRKRKNKIEEEESFLLKIPKKITDTAKIAITFATNVLPPVIYGVKLMASTALAAGVIKTLADSILNSILTRNIDEFNFTKENFSINAKIGFYASIIPTIFSSALYFLKKYPLPASPVSYGINISKAITITTSEFNLVAHFLPNYLSVLVIAGYNFLSKIQLVTIISSEIIKTCDNQ